MSNEAIPAGREMIRRASGVLNAIIGAAMAAMVTAIVFFVVLQIVMRALVRSSLVWTAELSGLLLVWTVALGIALAFRTRAHIAIDVVTSRLPDRLRKRSERIADVLSLVFIVILLVVSLQVTSATMGQITPGLRIPMGFFYLALPVGAALALVNIVVSVIDPLRVERPIEEMD